MPIIQHVPDDLEGIREQIRIEEMILIFAGVIEKRDGLWVSDVIFLDNFRIKK